MRCSNENLPALAIGDVVIIKGEERDRNLWSLGIITELFKGKDRIVRAAKLNCGRSELERQSIIYTKWSYTVIRNTTTVSRLMK